MGVHVRPHDAPILSESTHYASRANEWPRRHFKSPFRIPKSRT
jgi:hypothetical protein